MIKFFHHLFNPHCPECAAEKSCHSCETLRGLLDHEKHEKQQLLDRLLERPKEEVIVQQEVPKSNVMSWKLRKSILEADDRKKAELLKKLAEESKLAKENEELEKELVTEEKISGN
jgi:hypothetical protein